MMRLITDLKDWLPMSFFFCSWLSTSKFAGPQYTHVRRGAADERAQFPDPTDEMMGRYASDSKELKGTPALPRLTGKSVMLYRFIFS